VSAAGSTGDGAAASVRTWLGFLAMCLGMFMAILDIQIVASSLPEIQVALHIPGSRLSWIQTTYLIAEVIAIPLTGYLTRLLTLRWLFVAAVAGFTLASVGCAASAGFSTLIVFRAVQGFCGGAVIPAVFTSVFLLFPQGLHVRATTIAGVFAVLAPTLGPIVGGYITETFSWHWLFLINLAPGILVTAVTAAMLRTGRPDWSLLQHFDHTSLVLLAVTLATLELVLKDGPPRGWGNIYVLALLLTCIVSGALLIRRSLRREASLVPLDDFGDRTFAIASLYSFILGAGLYGSVYLMPLFLGLVRDHTPFEIGTIMLVSGVAQLVTAPIAAPLERRLDPRLLTAFGFGLFGVGLIVNGFQTFETDFDGQFWPQLLRGVAVMFCILPSTALALEGRTGSDLAVASGLFNLMRNLGGAVGIAVIDTVLELRPTVHAARLIERLQAGDPAAALEVGLPLDRFHNQPLGPIDEATKEAVRPLIERAAAVASFNEAYFVLGACFLLSLLLLPLLRNASVTAAKAAAAAGN
jgi:DHA2 family multidrug resistance protein